MQTRPSGPGGSRAVVHVGIHKTGSTAFQDYLARWREELLRDHGILVHPGCFYHSHVELSALVIRPALFTPGRWLIQSRGFPATEEQMRAVIRHSVESEAPVVVFSIEELCYLRTDAEIETLKTLLAPRRIQPVVVLRRPADYLRSYSQTLERIGFVRAARQVEPPSSMTAWYTQPDSWLVDYAALVRALERLGDGVPPAVVDYDAAVGRDGSIVPALLGTLGLGSESHYPGWDERANLTPPSP